MNKSKKTKFVTNVYPNSKIEINGPSEIYIKEINNHGQVVIVIVTDKKNLINKFKLSPNYSIDNEGNI